MSGLAVFFGLSLGMIIGYYLATLFSSLLTTSSLKALALALSSSWDAFPMMSFLPLLLGISVNLLHIRDVIGDLSYLYSHDSTMTACLSL